MKAWHAAALLFALLVIGASTSILLLGPSPAGSGAPVVASLPQPPAAELPPVEPDSPPVYLPSEAPPTAEPTAEPAVPAFDMDWPEGPALTQLSASPPAAKAPAPSAPRPKPRPAVAVAVQAQPMPDPVPVVVPVDQRWQTQVAKIRPVATWRDLVFLGQ